MTGPAPRYTVPGLERGLRMLQLFDRARPLLSAAEMARALDIPRSTAFRIAQTLESLGFLRREGERYRIGTAVLRLGFEFIASLELPELGRPVIERLCAGSGLAAQLVIRDGREVVVVLKASPPSSFASNVTVGTRLPAHATILGRVLLAGLDRATLHALYPEPELAAVSPNAPRTREALEALLEADRARGYAVSESFFEQGVSAVAAPVHGEGGATIAAISVTVQRAALEAELRERLVRQVLAAARELSRELDHGANAAAA